MAPEIYINNKLMADVPDETGLHQALDGSPLYVDVSGIEARNSRQTITLEGPIVGGKRLIGLTQEGLGDSANRKRGDGKLPHITVALLNRPIRVSYKDKEWYEHTRTLAGPNDGGYYVYSKRTYEP